MTPQQQGKILQHSLSKDIELLGDQMGDKNRLFEEKIEQLHNEIYAIRVIVAGNGDPAKSLIVRFDRLEQSHKRSSWLIKAAVGTSVSSIVGIAGMLIKHFLFP